MVKLISKQTIYGRTIINQLPSALVDHSVVPVYLPKLLSLMTAVERATGYLWHVTSYVRDSPSHKRGYALDIAPDISPEEKRYYAVYNGSDPVLYKRSRLVRQLQILAHRVYDQDYDVGIFIEPDHLHMQLFTPESSRPQFKLVKWKLIKADYLDSAARSRLPML